MDLLTLPTTFQRSRGDFPDLSIVNMVAEEVTPEGKVVLQSRPGMEVDLNLGTDPVDALYQEDGVFSGDLFVVTGGDLYRDGTLVGAIDGTDSVTIDSFSTNTFINAGASVWNYDGATLTTLTYPDSADVLRLCVGASRLITIRKDTQRIYWSDPLSTTIDALAFAEAENSPDNLLDLLFVGDTLILFGQATTEFWMINEDPDLPFIPIVGRTLPIGIRATGATTAFMNAFAWVSDTNKIYIASPDNQIASLELSKKIEDSVSVKLWTFYLDSQEYLAVTLDSETWVFSSAQGTWSIFETYGEDNFVAHCYSGGYFGSSINGDVLSWTDTHEDFGSILERRFRVYVPMTAGATSINNVVLKADSGRTPYTTGGYATPEAELRSSRDGGKTFSAWKSRPLGAQGQYRTMIRWLGLGSFGHPGLLFEIRVTDPVPFRATALSVNEPYGGL